MEKEKFYERYVHIEGMIRMDYVFPPAIKRCWREHKKDYSLSELKRILPQLPPLFSSKENCLLTLQRERKETSYHFSGFYNYGLHEAFDICISGDFRDSFPNETVGAVENFLQKLKELASIDSFCIRITSGCNDETILTERAIFEHKIVYNLVDYSIANIETAVKINVEGKYDLSDEDFNRLYPKKKTEEEKHG